MDRLLKKSVPESEAIGDRLKTFSAVYPGEHLDESEYIDKVLEVTDAEGNFIYPEHDEFFAETGEVRLLPGGAAGQHRPLRPMVRHA